MEKEKREEGEENRDIRSGREINWEKGEEREVSERERGERERARIMWREIED